MVIDNGWSSVSLRMGSAYFKKFDYPLKMKHLKAVDGCDVWVYDTNKEVKSTSSSSSTSGNSKNNKSSAKAYAAGGELTDFEKSLDTEKYGY